MLPCSRRVRGVLAAGAILAQFGFLLAAAPELAAAAPCPLSAPPPAFGNPPPPGILPTLPQSGGGGAAEFCLSNPAACQTGGPAPGFSPPASAASAALAASGPVLAIAGSAPGHGHGTLLMLALPVRLAACGGGVPALPGPALPAIPAPCPPPPPPPTIDARGTALGLAVPWPALRIGVNPGQWGLTGLPSRFWVAGYDGSPLTVGTHVHKDGLPGPPGCPGGPAADLDVQVRAVVSTYAWNFGDGLPNSHVVTTDLGRAYPAVSTIQHEYMSASTAGFPLTLTAHFALSYQAGGGWQPLGTADRTVTATYRVQQAVPVVVNQR